MGWLAILQNSIIVCNSKYDIPNTSPILSTWSVGRMLGFLLDLRSKLKSQIHSTGADKVFQRPNFLFLWSSPEPFLLGNIYIRIRWAEPHQWMTKLSWIRARYIYRRCVDAERRSDVLRTFLPLLFSWVSHSFFCVFLVAGPNISGAMVKRRCRRCDYLAFHQSLQCI